ncbi:hypothetical protein [Cytobacillus sp. Bac17]|uniref:hypothetical protein n=1 Tax=Cytobacillus sp. Bac17 TaxID=2926008 RepID=UPI002117B21B|nr:hypothetical protein [Cytobacillus sp. Bac17]
MNRKLQMFFLTFVFLLGGVSAAHAGYATASFDSTGNRMLVTYNPSGLSEMAITYYTAEGWYIGAQLLQGSGLVDGDYYLYCNGTADFKFTGSSGVITDSVVTSEIDPSRPPAGYSSPPDCSPKKDMPARPGSYAEQQQQSGESGGCIGCDLFNCPGWSQYMGKLEEIKSAIPPAPNWQEVANTFRDTIAPRIKSDMEDLFGYAPIPPNAPNPPGAPALPEDLDNRGIQAPTGQEAPGLEDSVFSPDDIKNGAPKIPEREDPTGGFDIIDPIGSLPSQDEFIENAPVEGEAPLPADPNDPDNFAPNPPEGDNVAPSPNEGDNYTPPNPSEPENMAPTPGDTTGSAPLPSESGTAPIPGDTNGSAPIPSESGTAPLPGQP